MATTVGKIYSDTCGYCLDMANDWNIMKTKVIKGGVNVVEFEKSRDSAKLEEFKQKHKNLEYSGFPTIFKIGGDGKIEYYNGERTSDKMTEWALKNSATNGGYKKAKKTKKAKTAKKSKKTNRKTKKSCCWLW